MYCLSIVLPCCFQAAWDADDEVLAAAIRNIDASISGALLAFNYRTDNPLGECAVVQPSFTDELVWRVCRHQRLALDDAYSNEQFCLVST
jgi:hypothetical protein